MEPALKGTENILGEHTRSLHRALAQPPDCPREEGPAQHAGSPDVHAALTQALWSARPR